MSELVGVVHVLICIVFSTFPFLFKKTKLDIVYLAVMYFLVLHWTFLNGECVITYLVKVKKEPNYKAGQNPKNQDMDDIYPNETLAAIAVFILNILWLVSIYVVFKRNQFSNLVTFSYLGLYSIYKVASKSTSDHHINPTFLNAQEFVKYGLLVYGLFVIPLFFARLAK